jgi:hypothetical protein
MPRKHYTPEQIVTKFKQIEVLKPKGKQILLTCKEVAISLTEWELSLYNTAISSYP